MPSTILIIDDNEDDILLTKFALKKIGKEFLIETAKSGEAGLTLILQDKNNLKLILLDLKMYGMDGLELLKKIRSDGTMLNLPVAIVTHSNLKSDRVAAEKAGANYYLNKTPDLNKFKSDLEHILNCII
jgi:CheY-like chemotaxis protein